MLVLSNNILWNKNDINVSAKNIFIEDRKFIVNTDFEISRTKKVLMKLINGMSLENWNYIRFSFMMFNNFMIFIDRKISFKNLKCSQTKSKVVLRRFIFS